MTHSVLAEVCRTIVPKLNPNIMRGLSAAMLKNTDKYLERVCRRFFNNCIPGMEFIECVVCDSNEEYNEITRPRSNRRVYDFAQSDIYMLRLKMGVHVGDTFLPLPDTHLHVIFSDDGSLSHLSGTLYHLRPVLTNKVISPGQRSLFVRMLGTKKNFFRSGYSIKEDGVTRTTYVTYASIYDGKPQGKGAGVTVTRAVSCMTHYLLQRYGFEETFRRYTGSVPVVGTETEITEENYPNSDWVIISTAHTNTRPHGWVDNAFYNSTNIRLAIRRDKYDTVMKSLVSEFFYIVDHFPQSVSIATLENKNHWLILLGYIVIGGQFTVSKIFDQMQEHLTTLDDFMDDDAIERLSQRGKAIDNFYDLVAMLTTQFAELLKENDRAGNIYEKYYDVVYSTMRPITYALNNVRYALQRQAKRITEERLEANPRFYYDLAKRTISRSIKPGWVYGLIEDKSVLEVVGYCGDHWYPRLTSKVSEQERAANNGAKSGRGNDAANDILEVSHLEGGSLLFLTPKSGPPSVINPYVDIDLETGIIRRNEDLRELLAETQVKLEDK